MTLEHIYIYILPERRERKPGSFLVLKQRIPITNGSSKSIVSILCAGQAGRPGKQSKQSKQSKRASEPAS